MGAVTSSECFGDGYQNAGLGALLPPKAGEQICRGTSLSLSSFLPGSASFPILSVPPTRITPHCTPLSPSWASNHESTPSSLVSIKVSRQSHGSPPRSRTRSSALPPATRCLDTRAAATAHRLQPPLPSPCTSSEDHAEAPSLCPTLS